MNDKQREVVDKCLKELGHTEPDTRAPLVKIRNTLKGIASDSIGFEKADLSGEENNPKFAVWNGSVIELKYKK